MTSESLKFNLRSIVEKNKLNNTNFLDWERNLRIVLRSEGKDDVLETPIPELTVTSSDEDKTSHKMISERSRDVACLMLAAMEPDLQHLFKDLEARTIMRDLRELFHEQVMIARYGTFKDIMQCRLKKGKPVGPHVSNMIGLFDRMARFGNPYPVEMATNIILHSLHDGFADFKNKYYMEAMGKTLNELHAMLKAAEQNVLVESMKNVLMINKGKGFKKNPQKKQQYKGKGKKVVQPTVLTPEVKVVAEDKCFYCKAKGHWKRNCPKYLEDKMNGTMSSTSGTKK